ncbi:TonB-dependent receptor [Flammeovirga kamogawensis]|uniref:TonB-dependent receptor n=1 Tax=Flammeovirga kamogawensis TaxID=373891 RepID=A0ABX8GZ27_9BACT|nr:TonB-dependent receptor [Flammeovirga kamogawensis]MBB6460846.1 outer membrane cobalamin receptor [Flammeovirga kamogawensis]QWG08195.1 TonB-dependent receptor [Flammeovirga kamogawensis]TRX69998.1 TonB-dependent receptor [Flammeovirga kamogawensis]
MKKTTMLFLAFLISLSNYAQEASTVIKGTIIEKETDQPVIGASIVIKGTTIGTTSDFDGNFTLKTSKSGPVVLDISFVGLQTIQQDVNLDGSEINLGNQYMPSDAIGLAEVEVVASVAVDRKTPVAVSTIKPEVLEEKLGTQEFPEILKSTPGVYATKSGGGYGDSRINLRGFSSANIAVMINGVPVNDMENGSVYWSNWAGLSDVTRTMQVQRGLGASKVAVPSVGGTINILTKTTDAKKGGNLSYGIGNDGYSKIGFTASTGQTENGWAVSVSGSKTTGVGFVDGTTFEGYSYFANVSKKINDYHQLSFTVFGAPQVHGQRRNKVLLSDYKESGRGIKYNGDWGYRNGEEYNVRENYYHKPQISLNWFWNINDKMDLATVLYSSIGRGGGSGGTGVDKFGPSLSNPYRRDGVIDFDKIVDENIANGRQGSESIIYNGVNNHQWYGGLSTLTAQVSENITFTGGLDIRYYEGNHYREVKDLLGGQFYFDPAISNAEAGSIGATQRAVKVGDKIQYNNDGLVWWQGIFAQAEYSKDKLSAFLSLSGSNQSFQRIDYMQYAPENQKTDWQSFFGYNIKGGANYNLTDVHNVFVNGGYFSRQPFFNSVWPNYNNNTNEGVVNEKALSFELGYGYRGKLVSGNINVYHTTWKDKYYRASVRQAGSSVSYSANIPGLDAVHSGVELDFVIRPNDKFTITGMASIGNWKWDKNVTDVPIYDDTQQEVGTVDVYAKGLHVGDAAQTTAALGLNYVVLAGLKVGADWNLYDRLFADFNVTQVDTPEKSVDSWQVPTYSLFDLNASYKFPIGKIDATLYAKVNNVFNTYYVSDAFDGSSHDWDTAQVFYGAGTTWSTSIKLNF